MHYYGTVWNYKGLLAAAADKSVDHPKDAYFAMQNIFSIFDDSLTRIPDFASTASTTVARRVFGYRKSGTGKTVATVWLSGSVPSDSNALTPVTLTVGPADFTDPVWVDIRDGSIRSIPPAQWARDGDTYTFTLIPLYDSPVLIADRSAIPLATPQEEWKRDYFPVPQHDDATVTGLTADPDRDGVINLLEYALASDPLQSGTGSLPVISVVPSPPSLPPAFFSPRPPRPHLPRRGHVRPLRPALGNHRHQPRDGRPTRHRPRRRDHSARSHPLSPPPRHHSLMPVTQK